MEITIGRICITPGVFFAVALLYYFDRGGALWALALSILIHEAGHLLALRLVGGRARRFDISCTGISAIYDGRSISYWQELIALAAGPAAGLLTAFLSAAAGAAKGSEWPMMLSGMSAALTLYNLLPLHILDGGRGLYTIISARFGPVWADKVAHYMDILTILGLAVAGFVLIWYSGNILLLLAALLLYIACCKKR